MKELLRALLMQTIARPADAARTLVGLNLPREAGWMALFLATIINTFAYFATHAIVVLPDDFWVPVFNVPIIYLTLSFSFSTMAIFGVYWTGQTLGGKAHFPVLVSMLAWLVCVQSLADFVFLGLLMIVPTLAGLFSLAAGLYGIWIFLNFVKVAHGFTTMGKAILTITLTLVGLIVGLSVFLSVIGITAMGIS
ncbi:hypothetical protein SAMN05444000_11931 [Shimia gijangensis]|uniref:Yip1 domain-containing protein n=1 Tax=Shimia gijangensis TaxID=1470563 RepID=A0A1M6PSL6_9RHOB|nr:YIP1 family protein [Shimia gijangensis]SHK10900.1 hypothetical protein SAMN05444000_11931 [Shimia gijangensis]